MGLHREDCDCRCIGAQPLNDLADVLPAAAHRIREGNKAKGFGFIPDFDAAGFSCPEDFERVLRTWCEDRLDGTAIGLIHGEVSEMLEARRRPGWRTDPSEHVPEFTAFVEEGADVIIRVLDLFARLDLEHELARAIVAKVAYNATRPFKHGRTF